MTEGEENAMQQKESGGPAGIDRFSLISDLDIYLFKQGKHYKLYEKLGSHIVTHHDVKGTFFAVWAPNARRVSVIGDFNNWSAESDIMHQRPDGSGIWERFVPHARHGQHYKYLIQGAGDSQTFEKFDPFAFYNEIPPKRASLIWDLNFEWKNKRISRTLHEPWSVYEVYASSWKKGGSGEERSFSYLELTVELVPYVKEMGFTHVEFLPLTEHPFSGSWGYQTTGYFAPTSRLGTPQEFMQLVDAFHAEGIGVIMDWVPSHFPEDSYALALFDGTHLYEHPDPRRGYHPDWKSLIFNYGRNEVRSFLISSAMFWAEQYRIDALRVDAVASLLYLDYSRKEGEWLPNIHGGNENLEAIGFLRELNEAMYSHIPGIQLIAEESTSWPMVSRPTYTGGLGFGMKWMMGWMHDTLNYFKVDPLFREYHQNEITFSIYYAFSENFMLPLSHDEVVHGKGSLISRMPGDLWQAFANLRALYCYMYCHPGAKLLFMGGEFGQFAEWNYRESLDWHLLEFGHHQGLQQFVKELNHFYTLQPALYERSFEATGFEWIDHSDTHNCVISFIRRGVREDDALVVVCNLTPVPRDNYRLGLPCSGTYKLVFNSDNSRYFGSGYPTPDTIFAEAVPYHFRDYSAELRLPPLSVIVLSVSH